MGVVRAWIARPLPRRLVVILLALWVIALFYMTVRPASGKVRLTLIPVIFTGSFSAFDTLANIAVFVPLGLLLATSAWRVLPTVAVGFSVSLAVEITQYIVDWGRTADINDLVTNACGAALGWSTAAALRACRRRMARRTAGSSPPGRE